MHPSLDVSKSRQENAPETLAIDLRIVEPTKAPRNNAIFRRTITACEQTGDFLVIVLTIASGYKAYRYLALVTHIHDVTHTVRAAAFGVAVLMVLILDR